MKKIVFTAAAMMVFAFVQAQDSEMKFGIKAGYISSNLTTDPDFDLDARSSFYIGGLMDYSISEKFHIQPEILYSMEGVDEEEGNLNFLTIPIMAKYYVTEGLNLQAGPQLAFVAGGDEIKDDLKSMDFRLGFGAGYEMEQGLFFDARYNLGLTDMSDIDGLEVKTGSFMVGLGYRF